MKVYSVRGPGPLSMDEPIRSSMDVVDLIDVPDYIALSYTWSDPRTMYTDERDIFPAEAWASPAFEIYCDGHTVSVATNLYTALIAILGFLSTDHFAQVFKDDRFGPHNTEYSYMWIDALCLNQDDLQEKSKQIPLMDRIYSQARATIMWLGGGELLIYQGLFKTMEKLQLLNNRLAEGLGPEDEELLVKRCKSFDICDPEAYNRLDMKPVDQIDLVGWYLLSSRSWFKRAWTVQEWVLSPNCFFLCGDLMFSPGAFTANSRDFVSRYWLNQIEQLVEANIVDFETRAIPTKNIKASLSNPKRPRRMALKYAGVMPLFRAKLDYSVRDNIDRSIWAAQAVRGFHEQDRPSKVTFQHRDLLEEKKERLMLAWSTAYGIPRVSRTVEGLYPTAHFNKPVPQSSLLRPARQDLRLDLTSGGVEPGDEVWILPGLNVPVVLRSMGGGWYGTAWWALLMSMALCTARECLNRGMSLV